MNRAQLLDAATRLIAWINTAPVDASKLAHIMAENVVVPIPYPGSTPDFAGLVATTEKIHGASPDFKMTIRESIIDESDCKVVLLANATGTQEKYVLLRDMLTPANGSGFLEAGRNSIITGLCMSRLYPLLCIQLTADQSSDRVDC